MIEPNCDMPWEVYLDWLQDQGQEDLRCIEMGAILSAVPDGFASHLGNYVNEGYGEGTWQSESGDGKTIDLEYETGAGIAIYGANQPYMDGERGYGCFHYHFRIYGEANYFGGG